MIHQDATLTSPTPASRSSTPSWPETARGTPADSAAGCPACRGTSWRLRPPSCRWSAANRRWRAARTSRRIPPGSRPEASRSSSGTPPSTTPTGTAPKAGSGSMPPSRTTPSVSAPTAPSTAIDYQAGVDFKGEFFTEGFTPTIRREDLGQGEELRPQRKPRDRLDRDLLDRRRHAAGADRRIDRAAPRPAGPRQDQVPDPGAEEPARLRAVPLQQGAGRGHPPADLSVYDFVVRHHEANLSASQPSPGEWAVLPGASTLDNLLPNQEPSSDTFLYYDDLDRSSTSCRPRSPTWISTGSCSAWSRWAGAAGKGSSSHR